MSIDLFYTQLATQPFSSGKSYAGITDNAASNSSASDDQGFLKALERLTDNQKPSRLSKPSNETKPPQADDIQSNGATHADPSQSCLHTANLIGVGRHHHAENTVTADGQTIDPAKIDGLNLLMELASVWWPIDANGELGDPKTPVDNAHSGVAGDQNLTSIFNGVSQLDLAKLSRLLMQFRHDGQNQPLIEIGRLAQWIGTLSADSDLTSGKYAALERLLLDVAGKPQGSHLPGDLVNDVCRNTSETLPANEKATLADLLKTIGVELAQQDGKSQNFMHAAQKTDLVAEISSKDKHFLAQWATNATPKGIDGGENYKALKLTDVIGPNSNTGKEQVQEIGQSVQKQLHNSESIGIQAVKSDASAGHQSSLNISNPPSNMKNGNPEQAVKLTNQNLSLASVDKAGAEVLTAESSVKDNGLLFNQSQNEVKTPESNLVTSEAEVFQKDFRAQTLNQIVQKAVLHLKDGQNEVRLDLKPDFLGHIRMQIITESHQVTVRILTEYPMVKELIENNFQLLKTELQNHGLKIDELEVSVDHNPDQHVNDRNREAQSKVQLRPDGGDSTADGAPETAPVQNSRLIHSDENTRIDFFA
ncbi:MAG: flagellar hook-length control protein FliK [Desulfobacterales bacterium]|nr:MAG: flagellar hook-length control protein FliK [Desulfobacterales bacterium]